MTNTNDAAGATQTAGLPPALHRFALGEAQVTVLLDGHFGIGQEFIASYDEAKANEAYAKGPYEMTPNGLFVPVQGYLIERGDEKILIDAGSAHLMGPGLGALGGALVAAGVRPEQITEVVLTHMHADHSGGLIDVEGRAVFANAQVTVSQTEWDFWHDDANMAAAAEGLRGFFDMARASVAPYVDRMKMFDGEAEVARGITAVPLPGHTPGHHGYMLDGGGNAQLLFWGDTLHSTALQFANPEWTLAFDVEPDVTVTTRRKMLDRAASDNLLVAGSHIDFPSLGRVQRNGENFAYRPAPWQFGLIV